VIRFLKIKKRSGKIEKFQRSKIKNAILKSMKDLDRVDSDVAEELTKESLRRLEARFTTPTTEDVQEIVEDVLISYDLSDLAKSYILHRARYKGLQDVKNLIGIKKDVLKLSINAITVLEKRYLLRNGNGELIETPKQMFQRVSKHVASIEKDRLKKRYSKEFYEMMSNLEFLPNTPCLVNSGNKMGQLAACFVLPVEDSMEGIYESLKHSALIFQSGGGVGYDFSKLRRKGALINSTNGISSGPVSFMEVFDKSSNVIKQRSASKGVLKVDHPDILDFVNSSFENFNISVAVTDDFMKRVISNESYTLKYPWSEFGNDKVSKLKARDVFELICANAWTNGDPGLIFIDEINRKHTLKKLGRIRTTNSNGEVDLLDYESCVLGSVNLSKMIKDGRIDWVKLDKTVRLGVRFLDNMIEVNNYPLKVIERVTKANRKIGLGVMGWADFLLELEVKYDSYEGLDMAKKVMSFIRNKAEDESVKLGKEKGVFENFNKSSLKKKRRNATLLAIAPTGSISLVAGCNSGIEPLFGLAYVRNILSGASLFEMNKRFEEYLRYRGLYSKDLVTQVARDGSLKNVKVPNDVKKLFVTAFDVKPEWHVRMQAVFQKYVDNAVSKTVNLPKNASVDDIKKIYVQAFRLKCKGITVYREGSKDKQVLNLGDKKDLMRVNEDYSGGCLSRNCEF